MVKSLVYYITESSLGFFLLNSCPPSLHTWVQSDPVSMGLAFSGFMSFFSRVQRARNISPLEKSYGHCAPVAEIHAHARDYLQHLR